MCNKNIASLAWLLLKTVGMGANLAAAERPFDGVTIAMSRPVPTTVPHSEAMTCDPEIFDALADPLGPAKGILVGLLLCVPFWVAVCWMLL